MALPPPPSPSLRALPKQIASNDLFVIQEATGRGSLLQLIDSIRKNLSYHQSRRAIKIGLKPATVYLAQALKRELPKSRRSQNVLRPSGSTAKSVAARLGAPPGRRGIGREPIGRVVLRPPHGFVYNFFKGTGPRFAAVISRAKARGLWKEYQRGVGGWGLGAARGSMPKIFDIETFMLRHRDNAINLMVATFNKMVNAYDFDRPPRSLRDLPEGQDL